MIANPVKHSSCARISLLRATLQSHEGPAKGADRIGYGYYMFREEEREQVRGYDSGLCTLCYGHVAMGAGKARTQVVLYHYLEFVTG